MIPVVYNTEFFPSFAKFGLKIPMGNDRFLKIIENLPRSACHFKPKIPINEISENDPFFQVEVIFCGFIILSMSRGLFSENLIGLMNRCFEYTNELGLPRYGDGPPSKKQALLISRSYF